MAGVRIGVDKLHYAVCTDGDAETWGKPSPLKGVITANINPNASQETLFADDGPYDTAATTGNIEVEINKAELTMAERAALLGHSYTNGKLVYKATDVAPFVAIGFRTLKSNGHYKYVWLLKGKFIDPEENNETKGDSINWQTDTITGQFLKTNINDNWRVDADEDDKDAASVITTWFDAVVTE